VSVHVSAAKGNLAQCAWLSWCWLHPHIHFSILLLFYCYFGVYREIQQQQQQAVRASGMVRKFVEAGAWLQSMQHQHQRAGDAEK
jgi:hypothetical protein